MKKALEVSGILLMSAILSCVLLYFFKPEALGKFSKNSGGGAGQEMNAAYKNDRLVLINGAMCLVCEQARGLALSSSSLAAGPSEAFEAPKNNRF